MWTIIARTILRKRWMLLGIVGLITLSMGFFAKDIKMSYELAQMLPKSDSLFVRYQDFKQLFGEDGNVIVVGVTNPHFFEFEQFNAWYDLGNEIRNMDGIEEVISVSRAISLFKNDSTRKFDFSPVVTKRPTSQAEVDSIKNVIYSMPFYRGLLYNPDSSSYLILITLNKTKLNDKSRVALVLEMKEIIDAYAAKNQVEIHFSGLPYIRTLTSEKIKHELNLFVILSLIIAVFILIAFFRSARAVLSSLVVVALSVVFTLGFMSLLNFKITILTGILPSLLIVIGIENCIFLINKYHFEYKSHGNKVKALARIIQRIGTATFITNATTAAGFATFMLTSTQILREFGLIASLSIMFEFLLSIILIPIFFSFMPSPRERHIKHLENRIVGRMIEGIVRIISSRRTVVYITTVVLLATAIAGMTMMKTSGKMVDDLPESDPVYRDLKYFEANVKGVMPFEIAINTKKRNGVMKFETIEKINDLQNEILKLPYFSKPLSLAEVLKFARQAYYNGKESKYGMPSKQESNFILSYMPKKADNKANNLLHSFIDSTRQITRISFQMADVGLHDMNDILTEIKPKVDSIFDPADFDVNITGNSIVYTQGTAFLIKSLFQSVMFAIIIIALIMALLFTSWRMIIISMVPNLIPLLVVAGVMGFSGIPIKPSTIIIFSVALGISVDNAIHFLSRYRYELKLRNWDVKSSVYAAIREAGISMIYSSIVLVFGFSVFMISGFGGTQALGILISMTLFIAVFCNTILLPSFLLTMDKIITRKDLEDSLIGPTEGDNDDLEEEEEEESNKTQA